jgi:hypothetical protein
MLLVTVCRLGTLLLSGILASAGGGGLLKRDIEAPSALTLRITKNETADIASTLYGYMWEVGVVNTEYFPPPNVPGFRTSTTGENILHKHSAQFSSYVFTAVTEASMVRHSFGVPN